MPLVVTSHSSDGTPRRHWRPYRMPRWQDNLVDSVFYLYPSRQDADTGSKQGACGFLVSIPWDHPKASASSRHVYAVSNYHAAVAGGASFIRLNTKEGQYGVIETDPCEWFWNAGADVAVYRLDGSVHFTNHTIWQYSHVGFDEVNCTAEVLREYQIGPGDDVFSVGRFVDVHGVQQNTPLIRAGIIASRGLVSVSAGLPWNKEMCWIVEMRSRTGFSGSPIYVYIPPWQPNFVEAPSRKYGNFFFGPWLLGIHSSQIPGSGDEQSSGSGMVSVVPCSALEAILVKNEKGRQERASYEERFINAPIAILESSGPSIRADNPSHREDFTSLVGAAAKKRPPAD